MFLTMYGDFHTYKKLMAKEEVTTEVLQMSVLFLVEKDKCSQYVLRFLLADEGSMGTIQACELLRKRGCSNSISE